MRNDLVIRSEIMRSLTEEYNRRYKEGGLKLAWIEKAVNDVPEMWISVAERLPKTRPSILGQKSSKVIVAFQFDDGMQGTDTAHILNEDWVFEDRITVVNRAVTHWMPLPEPPEGGDGDG